MKILLPLDIVRPLEPILDEVQALIPLKDKELHLLHVNEAWPAFDSALASSGNYAEDWTKIVEEKAKTILLQGESLLKDKCAKVSSEIVSGPPALMIETVARDEQSVMTILVPRSYTPAERFMVGSVSSNVVKHGPGATLILRLKAKSSELKNVLIGIDGSKNSQEAMLNAVKIFGLDKRPVKVLLLHAVDVAEPIKYLSPVEFISRVEQNLLMEGETFLAQAKQSLVEAGVKNVDIALKEGKPAEELIAAAQSMSADLIVAGAEGRTAIQHFLLGSVSHRLAMHAPCSVAIIKRQHNPA